MPALALFAGYFTLLLVAMIGTLRDFEIQNTFLENEIERVTVEELSRTTLEFFRDRRQFPTDIASLASTPGYEHAAAFNLPNIYYRVSPVLNSSSFRFRRASVAWTGSRNSATRMTAAEFFSDTNNQCGANAFDASGSWCGRNDAYWWKQETRWDSAETLELARLDLTRTLAKFSVIFSLRNPYTFPGPEYGLNPGDTASLSSLVGAPATSAACAASAGVFRFEDFDFDCSDLFVAKSGQPVFYTYVDPFYIVLSGATAELNSAGETIVVSQEMLAE